MTNLDDLSDSADWVDELPKGFGDGDPCPKCGSDETALGYGLAGGGMGPYATCERCGWMGKEQDDEGEDERGELAVSGV